MIGPATSKGGWPDSLPRTVTELSNVAKKDLMMSTEFYMLFNRMISEDRCPCSSKFVAVSFLFFFTFKSFERDKKERQERRDKHASNSFRTLIAGSNPTIALPFLHTSTWKLISKFEAKGERA